MEQIKAPTARDLRSFGGSAERYYEAMRARLAAQERAKTPEVQFAVKLINAGGNLWEQSGHRRIYFNSVNFSGNKFGTGYFDMISGEWVLVSSSPEGTNTEFRDGVLSLIAAGVQF